MTKRYRLIFLICGYLSFTSTLSAQLSPGDLAQPHAHLEGLLSCTKCHDLGKGVSESKCLDCHVNLQERILQDLGFHASREVRQQSCFTCHSDHHGRNFDMIHLDESAFEHELTGYVLEGTHAETDCRSCHQPDFIGDIDLQKKPNTFLGLKQDCNSCHEDPHQGTLGGECRQCHDFSDFKPASLFDHNNTDFVLRGKHQELDCERCHQTGMRNNLPFQEFAGLEFSNCTSCHEDVHDNRFGQNCTSCHSEKSFQILKDMEDFDHNQTRFALQGSHTNTACFSCHEDGRKDGDPFQEFVTWQDFACEKCHDNPHLSDLGSSCSNCHQERSFRQLRPDHQFDHALTAFALEGKHNDVDCRACHTDSKVQAIPHNLCASCHSDFHEGSFDKPDYSPDCTECHTTEGFQLSTFSIVEHNQTDFPLDGAHLATPCISCHLIDNEWNFVFPQTECIQCHDDIHKGILDSRFYPNQNCAVCHSVNRWSQVSFDHEQTDFSLQGKHLTIKCNDCHNRPGITGRQVFLGTTSICSECHQDVHYEQFELEGVTDCSRCHGFSNWEASRFDHDLTNFKLEGKHKEISCSSCHEDNARAGKIYTLYKIEKFECATCHAP